MSRKILCLALLLLLMACGSGTPKLRPLAKDDVILAFGDSLTYGIGAGTGESYPDVLQTLTGHPVARSGVPGEITAESLARLPGVLDETRPKLMVLCIGGNDFLRRLGEKQATANIREMILLAKSREVEVVLVGVPQFGLTLSPPDSFEKLAEALKIPYEDEVMQHILLTRDLKADEVHPNALGYRLFAEAVAKLLKNSGAI